MKMGKWLCLTVAVLSVFAISCDDKDEAADSRANFGDSAFAISASIANVTEVAVSQIVADSSDDSTIIAYAEMMVAHHTAAQQQLQTVASQAGLAISNTIDQDHQMLMDSLLTLKGRSLDSVYIFSQVRDHAATIDRYKEHTGSGLQRHLKQYNYDVIPVLISHLEQAQTIAGKY